MLWSTDEASSDTPARDPLCGRHHAPFKKSGFEDLAAGDYAITVTGRFIDEAERFAVYLTFGPAGRRDLPSFYVADTSDRLATKTRPEMLSLVRETTSRAATRLALLLTPQLEAMRRALEAPLIEEPLLPLSWGPLDIPNVASKSKAIRNLLDASNQDTVRISALQEIKAHVFDQQKARNAVELCLLRDPDPQIRSSCAEALMPAARTHAPSQRIVLHAMRREVDRNVLETLTSVSRTFVGLSRTETLATWLELVASHATPAETHRAITELLGQEGDVPNLDYAVAACLAQQALVHGKHGACLRDLVPNIPISRRRSILAGSPVMSTWALPASEDVASRAPETIPAMVTALESLASTHVFISRPHGSDPNKEIASTLDRLRARRRKE